jgi:hypothetical protein
VSDVSRKSSYIGVPSSLKDLALLNCCVILLVVVVVVVDARQPTIPKEQSKVPKGSDPQPVCLPTWNSRIYDENMIPREEPPAFQVVVTAGLLSKCTPLLMILRNGMLLCYEEYLGCAMRL